MPSFGLVRKLKTAVVLLGASGSLQLENLLPSGQPEVNLIAPMDKAGKKKKAFTATPICKQHHPCKPVRPDAANIPGWAATVIKQAVLLLGCCDLHFLQRLGSTRSFLGRVHSRIFGSGGKMRLRVDPPFSSYSQDEKSRKIHLNMPQV